MMRRRFADLFVACSLLLVTGLLRLEAQQRPRIGLVLGGGGARGGAHVGVLRVLEELRIPIDAIAGSSMGAIVGGLYAAGLRADEIERELTGTDWERVFATRPPRRQTDYRRKQDDHRLLVDFELGFRDGRFRLPGGFVGGHESNVMLEMLTLHVSGVRDFDELPIPFRAADVVLQPELGNLSTLDFDRIEEAVAAGVAATRSARAALEPFALPPAEWNTLLQARARTEAPIVIDFVRIEPSPRVPIGAIEGRLRLMPGNTVDADALAACAGRRLPAARCCSVA